MDEPIRIDKYLWAVRLYKTRSLATDACRCGYEVSIEQLHRVIQVRQPLGNRVGAKLVENFMTDLTPQEEYERIQMVRQYAFEKRDRGSGRPTKRERRDIEEFKYK